MMQLLESVGVELAGKGTGGSGDKEFGRVGTVVAELEQQLEATRSELQRSQEEVKRLLQDKEEACLEKEEMTAELNMLRARLKRLGSTAIETVTTKTLVPGLSRGTPLRPEASEFHTAIEPEGTSQPQSPSLKSQEDLLNTPGMSTASHSRSNPPILPANIPSQLTLPGMLTP